MIEKKKKTVTINMAFKSIAMLIEFIVIQKFLYDFTDIREYIILLISNFIVLLDNMIGSKYAEGHL